MSAKDLTPFQQAGYTEETLFKVLRNDGTFHAGDLVRLHSDDGTNIPMFIGEDRSGPARYLSLPGIKMAGSDYLAYHSGPHNQPAGVDSFITDLDDDARVSATRLTSVRIRLHFARSLQRAVIDAAANSLPPSEISATLSAFCEAAIADLKREPK